MTQPRHDRLPDQVAIPRNRPRGRGARGLSPFPSAAVTRSSTAAEGIVRSLRGSGRCSAVAPGFLPLSRADRSQAARSRRQPLDEVGLHSGLCSAAPRDRPCSARSRASAAGRRPRRQHPGVPCAVLPRSCEEARHDGLWSAAPCRSVPRLAPHVGRVEDDHVKSSSGRSARRDPLADVDVDAAAPRVVPRAADRVGLDVDRDDRPRVRAATMARI